MLASVCVCACTYRSHTSICFGIIDLRRMHYYNLWVHKLCLHLAETSSAQFTPVCIARCITTSRTALLILRSLLAQTTLRNTFYFLLRCQGPDAFAVFKNALDKLHSIIITDWAISRWGLQDLVVKKSCCSFSITLHNNIFLMLWPLVWFMVKY